MPFIDINSTHCNKLSSVFILLTQFFMFMKSHIQCIKYTNEGKFIVINYIQYKNVGHIRLSSSFGSKTVYCYILKQNRKIKRKKNIIQLMRYMLRMWVNLLGCSSPFNECIWYFGTVIFVWVLGFCVFVCVCVQMVCFHGQNEQLIQLRIQSG